MDPVDEVVKLFAPLSFPREQVGRDLVFSLVAEDMNAVAEIFEELEKNKNKLNIIRCAVSLPNMEDVFMR